MTNSHQSNPVKKAIVKKNTTGFDTLISNAADLDYSSYIADALKSAQAPMSVEEIVQAVKSDLPQGLDLLMTVENALSKLYQAVEVTSGYYRWLMNSLNGTIIRHPLTAEEARQGFLLLDELEHAVLFPEFFQTHRSSDRILYIDLFGGPTIPAEAYIERKTWSLRLGPQFIEWIDEQGGQGRDDIIIMVKDAAAGEYVIRLHPREARDNSTIQSRNVQLTLKAEEMVREEQRISGSMTTWDLAARLLVNEIYCDSIPPDDLHCVLHQYSLLNFDSSVGYTIKDDETGPLASVDAKKRYAELNESANLFDSKYDIPAAGEVLGNAPAQSDSGMKDYDRYLDKLFQSGIMDSPITEQEYHVLKAELHSLNSLEKQFGYLLSEQRNRQHDLLCCLLIDPGSVADDDKDISNRTDFDDPSCWEN